ncbi:hypothetical protein [Rickettsiales endosymbiont of Trichoplax sp. H2]|uniref:hypothetical protein n=1 Tax=Rickettsiales endosymbiont of Trichoplax sp. H2 TaxID=2021221 RepID=UPI0012B33053|nr:hypothetical protein [Rickettsiales endosymbiont of Trichoplax sp. H2]MSO13815.1 hypothetical protein [Rickettsiales endosymbiont of Trichoplax sp. H2]
MGIVLSVSKEKINEIWDMMNSDERDINEKVPINKQLAEENLPKVKSEIVNKNPISDKSADILNCSQNNLAGFDDGEL